MVNIAEGGVSGPVLVCGLDPSSLVEADKFLSGLEPLGQVRRVYSSADQIRANDRHANWSVLMVVGWNALERHAKVLEAFRTAFADKPIVVLGRTNDPRTRMEAFVKGADNYVSPDCAGAEFQAKMRRLLRLAQLDGRQGQMKSAPIKLRGLEIWLEEMVVLQNGRPVHLSQRELAMLVFLAREHPASVSRRTLEREVFGFRGDPGTNVVAVHVHRLRRKISPDGDLLRTIPGGYQLN